jgi:hypothetical protein
MIRWDVELLQHLKKQYPRVPITHIGRRLKLPSGDILYVRGAIRQNHPKQEGFYDLGESSFKELVATPKLHCVLVFDTVENAFVIPREKIREIFENEPVYPSKGKTPLYKEWHFDIWKEKGRHVLQLNTGPTVHVIENFKNTWQIFLDFR